MSRFIRGNPIFQKIGYLLPIEYYPMPHVYPAPRCQGKVWQKREEYCHVFGMKAILLPWWNPRFRFLSTPRRFIRLWVCRSSLKQVRPFCSSLPCALFGQWRLARRLCWQPPKNVCPVKSGEPENIWTWKRKTNRKALSWGLQIGTSVWVCTGSPCQCTESSQPTKMMGGWKVRKILDTNTFLSFD